MIQVAADARKPVTIWLYSVALMITAMVILGGLTRLTEAGLSIVDWKPLMGTLPPLTDAEWAQVFAAYQQFPEYRLQNHGMSLSEFKFIFWMEYAHRLLGRLIGLVFALPLAWFALRRMLSTATLVRFLVLLFLGGLQGVVGWYMVKSGLVDVPRVSQYRLVLHLALAILALSLTLWYAFDLSWPPGPKEPARRSLCVGFTTGLLVLVGLQIGSGGLVAGLRAGHAFPTWPTMGGYWVPPSIGALSPWYLNLFENPITVQFFHRNFALLVATLVVIYCAYHWRRGLPARLRLALHGLAGLIVLQVVLGILTLIFQVPVALASLHQFGALLIWCLLLFLCHQARAQSITR